MSNITSAVVSLTMEKSTSLKRDKFMIILKGNGRKLDVEIKADKQKQNIKDKSGLNGPDLIENLTQSTIL